MTKESTPAAGSKPADNNGVPVTTMPVAPGSPSSADMRQRRRRRSRLMSTSSSMMSAGAAGIPKSEKHKISNTEALVHMVKATIGGGFLAMPEAFHNAGLVIGTVGAIVIGVAVLNLMSSIVRFSQSLRSGKYAAIILAESAEENGENENTGFARDLPPPGTQHNSKLVLPPMDYPDTVGAVFKYGARGRFARWSSSFRNFTSTALVVTYYGVNIIYVCIVAGTIKQLVDQYTVDIAADSWLAIFHGLSIRWYPAIAGVIIIPVGMVRLMKYLVPFSIAANVCLTLGTCAVFYFIFFGEDPFPLQPEENAKLFVWPATRWSLFAGSTLCSMEGVGMLLHIENVMKRPLELAGPPTYVLHRAMVIIISLNGTLGLIGYLRYGVRCAGSISLNLPMNNWLSDSVKLMIALGILLTYGLQLTVTADLAWQGLRPWLADDTKAKSENGETSRVNTQNNKEFTPRLTVYYYCMRFGLILGSILVATAVPNIGPLVSLVGSVGFSTLGLIIPVLLETVWYWYPDEDEHDDDGGDNEQDDVVSAAENGDVTVTNGGESVTKGVESVTNGDVTVTNGGEPVTNGGESMTNGGESVTNGGESVTNGGESVTTTENKLNGKRVGRRIFRNVKNVAVLLLAIFSLVGGAYYNVSDIISLATNASPTQSM